MKSLRILIVGINFHPEPISTGKYTAELASHLAEEGLAVRVVTAPPYYPWWRVVPPYSGWRYQRENWRKVEVWRCPLWVPRKPSGVSRLVHLFSFALSSAPALLMQLGWKPEVVLCIAPAFLNAPLALLTARLSGAQAWLHVQDFELDAAEGLGMLASLRPLLSVARTFERWLLQRFDRVSTISGRMREKLHEKGVSPEKTALLPNWVDTDSVYPLPDGGETLRAEWGISDNDVVVLYSGNFGHKQGLEYLIEAARLLQSEPPIRFVLCGEGPMRAELEQKVSSLSNVSLHPLQPMERLNLLLNSADIHVLPQRADAADLVMPSKLSGMLASGKAVIATARAGTELSEVVEQTGVVVPPENAAALAQAIRDLARKKEYREILGRKGREWVESHWSKENLLRDFMQHIIGA